MSGMDIARLPWSQRVDERNDLEGIRLLLRMLVSPQVGTYTLRDEQDPKSIVLQPAGSSGASGDPGVQILGFKQQKDHVKVTLDVALKDYSPTRLRCTFYYDPETDDLVLYYLSTDLRKGLVSNLDDTTSQSLPVVSGESLTTGPGLWRLDGGPTAIFEWMVLRRPQTVISGPRLRSPATDSKRIRSSQAPSGGQEPVATDVELRDGLLDLRDGETILFPGSDQIEPYQITMKRTIGRTNSSRVYLVQHSEFGDCVVVKSSCINPSQSRNREVRVKAETWLREFKTHSVLDDVFYSFQPFCSTLTFFRTLLLHSRAGMLGTLPCTLNMYLVMI